MDVLHRCLLFLHLVGMASLLGGFLAQLRSRARRAVPAMLHGAVTQLVTGIALVGVAHAQDLEVNDARAAVKLALLAVIGALLPGMRTTRTRISESVYYAIGGLALAEVAIAVFWT